MIEQFLLQIAQTPVLEWGAVLLAVAYLILAIRQSIWCWPCAFISTGIYVYLYGSVALYMESALNVFYLLVAVYGFWFWLRGGKAATQPHVQRWPWHWHLLAIIVIVALVFASGALLEQHTRQARPYLDAMTTWSAVWATVLTARKVLENWWYWLVIDAVSVWLYWDRGLALTALLFVFYLVLIPIGYLKWRQTERQLA